MFNIHVRPPLTAKRFRRPCHHQIIISLFLFKAVRHFWQKQTKNRIRMYTIADIHLVFCPVVRLGGRWKTTGWAIFVFIHAQAVSCDVNSGHMLTQVTHAGLFSHNLFKSYTNIEQWIFICHLVLSLTNATRFVLSRDDVCRRWAIRRSAPGKMPDQNKKCLISYLKIKGLFFCPSPPIVYATHFVFCPLYR